MFPIALSNPATADVHALLHLEDLLAEVEGERSARACRPAPRLGAPLRSIVARPRTAPEVIRRRLTRPIRTALVALVALAFAAGVAGLGAATPVAAQSEPRPRPLLSKPLPEQPANIIAVLIGL